MKETIKKAVCEVLAEKGVSVSSIILFGSRARGDADELSDWDLLVVTKEELSREDRRDLSHLLRKKLADMLIPSDVIIRSEREVEARKKVPGSIVRNALKEGIIL